MFVLEIGKMEEVPAAGHGYTCCASTLFDMPITVVAVMPRREDSDSFIISECFLGCLIVVLLFKLSV